MNQHTARQVPELVEQFDQTTPRFSTVDTDRAVESPSQIKLSKKDIEEYKDLITELLQAAFNQRNLG